MMKRQFPTFCSSYFPCRRNIMKPEKQRTRGAPRSERFTLSRLFCFNASQVDESDAPTPTSSPEMSPWSACFNVGEKRKKEAPVRSPANASARSRPARTVEDSRSKNPSAELYFDRVHDNDNKFKESSTKEASKFNENHNNGQPNLLRTKRRDYIKVVKASSAQSSYPTQTTPKGNESKPCKIASQSEKIGSSVGVRIMIITLAIMVFVGRGAAIICFCSCVYTLQLGRASPSNEKEKIASRMIFDANSAEYKKKVILEGFLERNGGRPLNIIRSKR